jgi:type VI secretion system protein VasI
MLAPLLALVLAQDPAATAPWKVREVKNELDDRTIVVLSREGDRPIAGLSGQQVVPTLSLRCSGGHPDVMIFTGTPAQPGRYFPGQVRLRFDAAKAVSAVSPKETNDHHALVFDSRWVFDQVLASKTLTFQFTPLSTSPQVVAFPLDGITDAITPHANACGVDMAEVGDPGVYVLLVDDPLEGAVAKNLAKKLSDKLKAESTLLPWMPGLPEQYVTVGRFAKREEALAFTTAATGKKVTSWEKMKVGRMNSKGTRLIDAPLDLYE